MKQRQETLELDAEVEPTARRARRRWRSIWLSDVHLGSRRSRADLLLAFLRENDCEHLYLVGDLIDGWSLRRSGRWESRHDLVLREILAAAARGTRVTYVAGNHDDFLSAYAGLALGGVHVRQEALHRTADGRRLLVLHGDGFDRCIHRAPWLVALGDAGLAALRGLDRCLNALRRAFGFEARSLAGWVRRRAKEAVAYVETFERDAAAEARRRGLDGVVCGHVHQPALRRVNGILYANDGDWVDSCTALVEDPSGRLALMRVAQPDGVAVPEVALA